MERIIEGSRKKDKPICSIGFFLPFDLFILFLAVLRLHCFACASSSCGAQVSHCGGFPGCTVWALGIWAHRLGCPEARGIFLDQG